jgi:hypothetical protein
LWREPSGEPLRPGAGRKGRAAEQHHSPDTRQVREDRLARNVVGSHRPQGRGTHKHRAARTYSCLKALCPLCRSATRRWTGSQWWPPGFLSRADHGDRQVCVSSCHCSSSRAREGRLVDLAASSGGARWRTALALIVIDGCVALIAAGALTRARRWAGQERYVSFWLLRPPRWHPSHPWGPR